jgi:hypothetical protein
MISLHFCPQAEYVEMPEWAGLVEVGGGAARHW